MNQQQIQTNNYVNAHQTQGRYISNPLQQKVQNIPENPQNNPIIEGYFPKENSKKEMAIRKINTTLTILLFISLFLTAVSYYFATANEMVLNDLSRQTVVLNDENADLQNKVDKLKSFNNVDITMQKSNILKKAQTVIEIPAVSSNAITDKKFDSQKPFSWAIGY